MDRLYMKTPSSSWPTPMTRPTSAAQSIAGDVGFYEQLGARGLRHSSRLPPPIGRRLVSLFEHLSRCCFRLV
jgi:hypothetical protein